jgi:hypothetical protein
LIKIIGWHIANYIEIGGGNSKKIVSNKKSLNEEDSKKYITILEKIIKSSDFSNNKNKFEDKYKEKFEDFIQVLSSKKIILRQKKQK